MPFLAGTDILCTIRLKRGKFESYSFKLVLCLLRRADTTPKKGRITTMGKEIWDGYTIDGALAGVDLVRGEEIPPGLYHLVGEILVRHVDGDYLLMQRDFHKESWPGLWEASAGGSALKGETALACARRELLEETGIVADTLEPIFFTVEEESLHAGFLCVTKQDKASVTLQEGETVAFRWVSPAEFDTYLRTTPCAPVYASRLKDYLEQEKALLVESDRLRIVPRSLEEMKALEAGEEDPEMKKAYGEMVALMEQEPAHLRWTTDWAVFLKTGELVGGIGFKGPPDAEGRVELGYDILPAYRRRGIASEAVGAMAGWSLAQLGVKAVLAQTEPDNLPSQKVLLHNGFTPAGMGEEGPLFQRV